MPTAVYPLVKNEVLEYLWLAEEGEQQTLHIQASRLNRSEHLVRRALHLLESDGLVARHERVRRQGKWDEAEEWPDHQAGCLARFTMAERAFPHAPVLFWTLTEAGQERMMRE